MTKTKTHIEVASDKPAVGLGYRRTYCGRLCGEVHWVSQYSGEATCKACLKKRAADKR